jgi:2-amino-4-hydroxy-6-hydroxymethyldihydropteridine diphosphokinase
MIFAALGGNLPVPGIGTPRDVVIAAAQVIDAIDISVIDQSPWYQTAPVPASDQPDFINGVILLETALSAAGLLARFHEIEDAFGRMRGVANAARTLDIDLLDYRGTVVGPPDVPPNVPPGGQDGLMLPHPRLQDRAFVLMPLYDLAPNWIDPRDGRSIDELIDSLPPGQTCRRLIL